MATTRWLISAVCQQLLLPTLAFKATDFCQLLKDVSDDGDGKDGDFTSRSSADRGRGCCPHGRGHMRRDIGNALDALACGWVNCLDAFRPARPAKFLNSKACAPAAQA
eukprot:351066-Chlamydomonas_euryale.AAC.1